MTKVSILKYGLAFFAAAGLLVVAWSIFFQKKLSRTGKFCLVGAAAIFLVAVDAYLIEPNWIQVNHVVIHDQKLADVLKGLTVVHVTDFHLTEGLQYREKQLIKKVNDLHPDLLFFTGDLFDDLSQVKPAIELFRNFQVKKGIFAVLGNTDHIVMDSAFFARELAQAGVDTLINQNREIRFPSGEKLWLIGVDDPTYQYDQLDRAMEDIPQGSASILLAHNPKIFDQAAKEKINLVLAGHTHGGQVGIPFLVGFSEYANRTPYRRGLFEKEMSRMYVNTGIGMKTLPIRFLCRPEIAVIEVRP